MVHFSKKKKDQGKYFFFCLLKVMSVAELFSDIISCFFFSYELDNQLMLSIILPIQTA